MPTPASLVLPPRRKANTVRSAAGGVLLVAFMSAALVVPLHAQTQEREPWGRASFAAGASFGDGDTALALTAAVGVRLSERLGMDVELAYARKLDFRLDLCPAPLVCIRGGQLPVTGRALAMVPQLAVDVLSTSRGVRLYVVAGVGAGHVRQRYFDTLLLQGERLESTRSSLTVATSFGGGVEVRIANRLALGADIRSLHLLDNEATPERFITPDGTLSTLRVTSRVSWRF